jgi:hypothetical protein
MGLLSPRFLCRCTRVPFATTTEEERPRLQRSALVAGEPVSYVPSGRACWYCLSELLLRRRKESSILAANCFAPNVSRSQPHQPGGKMKAQPYWTRQVVASIGLYLLE